MQRVTDAYAYNAWGEDVGQLRGSADAAKPENPYRYVGKSGYYSDNDTGLIMLGARYYDPLLGRFITQDPARDGLNWYAYAGNNPVNAVDPSGLKAVRLDSQMADRVAAAATLVGAAAPVAKRDLLSMIDGHKILYDADRTGSASSAAFGTITIGSMSGLYISGGLDNFRPSRAGGYNAREKAIVELAGTLYHEWIHQRQPLLVDIGYEKEAYSGQFTLLQSLGWMYNRMGDSRGVQYCNEALDTAWTDLKGAADFFSTISSPAYSYAYKVLSPPQHIPFPTGD